MLRILSFCSAALLGLSQLASAASISAVLNGEFANNKVGYATRFEDPNLIPFTFGPVTWPPADFTQVISVVDDKSTTVGDRKRAFVRTDVRRGIIGDATTFYLTSYSQIYQLNGETSVGTDTAVYSIHNQAYWEFEIVGNYAWEIFDQNPSVAHPTYTNNRRKFKFEKMGGPETILSQNSTGSGSFSTGDAMKSGTLGSGIYRFSYDHFDPDIYQSAKNGTQFDSSTPEKPNSLNLDIRFTFLSEGGGGGGGSGVVPEPSSVAVFGLLGVGSVVAKWRRKKLQSAS